MNHVPDEPTDSPNPDPRPRARRTRRRRRRRFAAIIAGSVALVLGAYAVVDAYDLVPDLPGILTTDPPVEVQAVPTPQAQGRDMSAPASAVEGSAPVPTTVAEEIEAVLAEAKVKGFGIEVRDGLSNDVLYAKNEMEARTPASVTKVLTAAAALQSIGGEERLTTTADFAAETGTVTLVGGGDVMLSAGESDPGSVNGHAGLRTLAEKTAASLADRNVTEVALSLDASRYTGKDFDSGWARADIAKGVIAPIQPIMIDTAYIGDDDREWRARSEHPAADASAAFAEELERAGITVTETDDSGEPATGSETIASVESATISEIVEYALVHSDNVVAEVLGNEVAIAAGDPGSLDAGPKAVLAALADSVDLGRTQLVDTSGLSYDNAIAPHDLTTILQASVIADGSLAGLISYFPVGGLTGTLTERLADDPNTAGVVHAKTGTLSTVTSLAGGVLDADGRYLVFTLQIDEVDKDKILEARKTVDDVVTVLANCGCR